MPEVNIFLRMTAVIARPKVNPVKTAESLFLKVPGEIFFMKRTDMYPSTQDIIQQKKMQQTFTGK
jgi:hypothetical protein